MQENKTTLSISTEVLEKMTQIATCEVEGVVSIAKKAIDIKDMVKAKSVFKGVKVENINGAIEINVYICIKHGADSRTIAQAVQANVKDKVQTMTGAAVTRVNVIIADLDFSEADNEE